MRDGQRLPHFVRLCNAVAVIRVLLHGLGLIIDADLKLGIRQLNPTTKAHSNFLKNSPSSLPTCSLPVSTPSNPQFASGPS